MKSELELNDMEKKDEGRRGRHQEEKLCGFDTSREVLLNSSDERCRK